MGGIFRSMRTARENLDVQTSSSATLVMMPSPVCMTGSSMRGETPIRRVNLSANRVIDESQAEKKTEFEQMDLFTDYRALEQEEEKKKQPRERERRIQEAMLDIKVKIWKERDLKRTELSGGGNGREKPTDRGT